MSQIEDKKLQPIWGQIAQELGVGELPEPVKTGLLSEFEPDIDVAIGTGDPEDLGHLVKAARAAYRAHFAPRKSRRDQAKTTTRGESSPEVTLSQYEELRAEVVSEYLAKMAALNPKVIRFREEVLGSEVLTPEEARAFLSSPATRFLTPKDWRARKIPAKHAATLIEEKQLSTENGLSHFVEMLIDPPGTPEAFFRPLPLHLPPEPSYGHLSYQTENGQHKKVWFFQESVLGSLRRACKELVRAHPWDIDEATSFVLTGAAPFVRPAKAKIDTSGVFGSDAHHRTISLTIQPWVPAETVASAYRQVQRQAIGGDNGRISNKNLELLRFATKRADAVGNLPNGRMLVEEWDKMWKDQQPQWCYGTDTRTFWRDFRSAQKSVAHSKRAGLVLEDLDNNQRDSPRPGEQKAKEIEAMKERMIATLEAFKKKHGNVQIIEPPSRKDD